MISPDQNEQEVPEGEEITKYRLVKWKTLRSTSEDRFRELLSREDNASVLDDDYIMAVAERWRELQRVQYRYSALLFFLVLFMGALNAEDLQHISIFGMKISGNSPALGILLLLTSVLMFFVTIVSLISDSYEDVVTSYIEVRKPDEVSKLYLLRFSWSAALFFGDAHKYSYRIPAKFTILGSAILLAASVIVAAALVGVLQYYLFISSIISVQASSQLPSLINVPIVVVAICAALFGVCAIVVKIPLPYWDYSNMQKLAELEESDPEKAGRIKRNIARGDLEREKKYVGRLQLIVVMAIAILPQVVLSGEKFFTEYEMLVPILTIPVLVFGVVAPLLDAFQRASFVKHCNAENTPVNKYVEWKRRMLFFRMIVCVVIGIGLFIAFYQTTSQIGTDARGNSGKKEVSQVVEVLQE